MAQPTFVGSHINGSSFASSLTGSFAVGSDPVSLFAFAIVGGAASLTKPHTLTLNSGAATMTPLTLRSMNTEFGVAGQMRGYELVASGLTGTVTYALSCALVSNDTSDGNGKPAVIFVWFKDGDTAVSSSKTAVATSAGNTMSATVASATGETALYLSLMTHLSATVTATGGTTKQADAVPTSSASRLLAYTEDGAASVALEATTSATTSHGGTLWSIAGSGGFTLTADQGSYSLTGQTVGTLSARTATADYGTYSLTGQSNTLLKETPGAFVIPADYGQYSITGTDAQADYSMNAEFGLYSLLGQDIALRQTFPQAYTLAAVYSSYTLTGRSTRLLWSNAPLVPSTGQKIAMALSLGVS